MADEPITNGDELLLALDNRLAAKCGPSSQRSRRLCPVCHAYLSTTGIHKLVYSFEQCDCSVVDYSHMVEQLWHRDCFKRQDE